MSGQLQARRVRSTAARARRAAATRARRATATRARRAIAPCVRLLMAWLVVVATTAVVLVAAQAPSAGAGDAWTTAPLPTTFGSDVSLSSISCADPTDCVAVGYYVDANNQAHPLADTLAGATWTPSTLPEPTGSYSSQLTGVSCTSVTTCVAVGEDTPLDSQPATGLDRYAFDEVLSAGAWTASADFPYPLNNQQLPSAHVVTTGGISCTAASTCVAVGSDQPNAGGQDGIAYAISGLSGTVTSGLAPAGQSVVQLAGVSCVDAADCTAVGYTISQALPQVQRVLVETLAAGSWTTTLGANPPVASAAHLEGVACTSATVCQAVGQYTGANGTFALAESLSGAVWTPTTNLTTGQSSSDLASVSCTAAASCVAAGSYIDSTSATHALVETLSATSWLPTTGIDPAGATSPSLFAVSCPVTLECVAVGNAALSSGGVELFESTAAPLPATQLSVTAPAAASQGQPVDVTVTALDANGSPVPDYSGTVHFTSTDLSAVLPADQTLVNGTATVPVIFNTLGSQTVTATDTVDTTITGTSASVTVSLPATHLAVTAPPSASVGQPARVTVTALDANGDVASGYTGTVHFTSTDHAAVLPADQGLANGTATVTVTFATPGVQTVTATDTSNPSITGTSPGVLVALAAVRFAVSGPPAAHVGQAAPIAVQAIAANGTVVTGYTGTVHFTSSDPAAALPPNTTFTTGDAGTLTVHVTFRTAGLRTVTATATGPGGVVGTSNVISVTLFATPPAAPLALSAGIGDGGVELTWVAPFNGGSPLEGYRVLRGAGHGGEVLLADDARAGFTDPTAVAGVRYYYEVEAYNAVGTSGPSNEVSIVLAGSLAGGRLFAGTPSGRGYVIVDAAGGVSAYGDARAYGSLAGIQLNRPIVTATITPTGRGYWMAASDGGIFVFGDAGFAGSLGSVRLNQPIVGMAATPDGRGYWLVASDGGIFQFGDARFYGSLGSVALNMPIIGMSASPDGGGYRLIASDGGVFNFGDARFFGSLGNVHLNQPIVGMTATPDGGGYWMVAADGGVFPFGDARFYGAAGATLIPYPIIGMVAELSDAGYSLIDTSGAARHYGS